MTTKTITVAVATALLCGGAGASPAVSLPAEVITSPSSVYWTTLVDNDARLVCAWPSGAFSAELRVTGGALNHVRNFTRAVGENVLDVECPAIDPPAKVGDERIYTFTLAFDNGETLTRRLASVRGTMGGGARVIADGGLESRDWQRVSRRALVPIVERGVEEVDLNGEATPAGLGGECGWFEWDGIPLGVNTFAANGKVATFLRLADQMVIILR